VVEAEHVLRVVAPLDLAQARELLGTVGGLDARERLVRRAVVEIAASGDR